MKTGASVLTLRAGDKFDARLVAAIDEGWHLYSPEQPAGGPLPTRITVPDGQLFKLAGEIQSPQPRITFDPNFEMETEFFEGEATFTVPIVVAAGAPAGEHTLTVNAIFQTCNETKCLPPKAVKVTAPVRVLASAAMQPPSTTKPQTNNSPQASQGEKAGLSVGDQVPDFDFVDFQDKPRKFSEFRGKYVLLDFWATWCKPCLADIPHLKDLYAKYRTRGFEILGLDSETLGQDEAGSDLEFEKETHERAKQIVSTRGVTWSQAAAKSAVPLATRVFGVTSLPAKLLIDRDGKVAAHFKEGDDIDAHLQRLLGPN
jgi:thiol-disulfide isomerase/thioredoxin